MRANKTGLHGGEEYQNCVACHSEHHGREYELITWPEGQSNFQHEVVDYEMSGAHLELDCRQCHNVKKVVDPGQLRAWNKDFDRTWLGLDQDCLSCHQDPHAGSLTAKDESCLSCHDTTKWQPASGFDHDSAAFVLTGRHKSVDCLACHTGVESPVQVADAQLAVARFKPQASENCASCHTDPHANALGPRCTDCHTTQDWLQINGDRFDHAKTRYPLTGKHLGVGCIDCHGQGRKKPNFAACKSCHQDSHDSVRLQKTQLMNCESCHDVAGFHPALYTIEQHAELSFPLRGAHQATACFECHKPLTGTAQVAKRATANLAPAHNACTDCHTDPHAGETTSAQMDCLTCHQEDTWSTPLYDHGRSGFVLNGAHEASKCVSCHQAAASSEILFSTASPECASCHNDVHEGKLVGRVDRIGQEVTCATCHVAVDWFAEKFDHEVHSRFSLLGGHEDVDCQTCHILAPGADRAVPIYKPLPIDCLSCHGNADPLQKRKS